MKDKEGKDKIPSIEKNITNEPGTLNDGSPNSLNLEKHISDVIIDSRYL